MRVTVASRIILAAFRCDAREEDLEALAVDGGAAVVPLSSRLTSLRLFLD